jgi:outer membrane lipoprotein-sorting protein
MKKVTLYIIILFVTLFVSLEALAQGELTGQEILVKVDSVSNGPKNQSMIVKITSIDKSGREAISQAEMYQEGSDKRLVKFLSPADRKGIGFLSLPNNVMYVYLPAFGKVRRIAAHMTNSKFSGTDFTYEDLEAGNFAEKWLAQLERIDGDEYVLKLTPKEGVRSDYSKLIMWVRMDNFCTVKIEYYDRGENRVKVMTRDKMEKIDGHWTFRETQMEDLKVGQKTIMLMEDLKFDTDLPDQLFTERYLMR